MKYIICTEQGVPVTLNGTSELNSKKEANTFIENHLIEHGLDYRVGYLFKSRRDVAPYKIIIKATGIALKP